MWSFIYKIIHQLRLTLTWNSRLCHASTVATQNTKIWHLSCETKYITKIHEILLAYRYWSNRIKTREFSVAVVKVGWVALLLCLYVIKAHIKSHPTAMQFVCFVVDVDTINTINTTVLMVLMMHQERVPCCNTASLLLLWLLCSRDLMKTRIHQEMR